MTLTDEVANLNIESEPPTRAEPTPAPVDICCDALTDEWETTLKSYTGPQLSERALNPAHGFIGAEKLDTILRNSELGRRQTYTVGANWCSSCSYDLNAWLLDRIAECSLLTGHSL